MVVPVAPCQQSPFRSPKDAARPASVVYTRSLGLPCLGPAARLLSKWRPKLVPAAFSRITTWAATIVRRAVASPSDHRPSPLVLWSVGAIRHARGPHLLHSCRLPLRPAPAKGARSACLRRSAAVHSSCTRGKDLFTARPPAQAPCQRFSPCPLAHAVHALAV